MPKDSRQAHASHSTPQAKLSHADVHDFLVVMSLFMIAFRSS